MNIEKRLEYDVFNEKYDKINHLIPNVSKKENLN